MIADRPPMAETSLNAPYDTLRPLLCRNIHEGRVCNGVMGEINWSEPGTHSRKCQRCKAINVTHVHVHCVGALDSHA